MQVIMKHHRHESEARSPKLRPKGGLRAAHSEFYKVEKEKSSHESMHTDLP